MWFFSPNQNIHTLLLSSQVFKSTSINYNVTLHYLVSLTSSVVNVLMGQRFDGVVFTHVQNSGDAAKRTESSRLVSPIENSQLTTIRRTLLSAAVKNIAAIIIIIIESRQKKRWIYIHLSIFFEIKLLGKTTFKYFTIIQYLFPDFRSKILFGVCM